MQDYGHWIVVAPSLSLAMMGWIVSGRGGDADGGAHLGSYCLCGGSSPIVEMKCSIHVVQFKTFKLKLWKCGNCWTMERKRL